MYNIIKYFNYIKYLKASKFKSIYFCSLFIFIETNKTKNNLILLDIFIQMDIFFLSVAILFYLR